MSRLRPSRAAAGGDGDQGALRLGPELLRRLGSFSARMEALRKRREGGGGGREQGPGEEWVGYRPYRAGDDVRGIDWNLLARLDQPFVKLRTRAVSERWTVWIDASGSMGVGDPSKFQSAVECGLGLAALGLARGAEVRLELGGEPRWPAAGLRRVGDLGAALERLREVRCRGASGLPEWLAAGGRGAGRVVLVGDLLDVEPTRLARAVRPGVEWIWIQLLAPRELELGRDVGAAAVEFVDPEAGAGARALRVSLEPGVRAAYQRRLGAALEGYGRTARRHRIRYGCFEAGRPFEDLLRELLQA